MTSSSRRIAVTGLGAVCSLGDDMASTWRAARDGVSGLAVTFIDPGPYGPPGKDWLVGLVKGDTLGALEAALDRRIGASLDPFALFSLKAAHEALSAAGLIGSPALAKAAVVFGHGIGGLTTQEKAYERFFGMKVNKVHPLTVPRVMVSAPSSAIAMTFGIKGPVFAVSSACSSSGHAICQGAMLIQSGRADIAVVGGGEALITAADMHCWEGIQATTETACRPFSLNRDGMVIAEGGAGLILEEWDHAVARGAPILAELARLRHVLGRRPPDPAEPGGRGRRHDPGLRPGGRAGGAQHPDRRPRHGHAAQRQERGRGHRRGVRRARRPAIR